MIATIKRHLAIRRTESAGRLLALEGHRQYKQRVRDKCDEMRRNMGLKPVDWGKW